MRIFTRQPAEDPLKDQTIRVLRRMDLVDLNSDEYSELMTKLQQLHELRQKESAPPLSKDALFMVLGNLAGILVIVAYEQKHVFTSKGIQQLLRLKTP
jgi:hypothetical protein